MEAAIAGQNDPEIWQARSSGSINDYGLIISELKLGLLPAEKEHVNACY